MDLWSQLCHVMPILFKSFQFKIQVDCKLLPELHRDSSSLLALCIVVADVIEEANDEGHFGGQHQSNQIGRQSIAILLQESCKECQLDDSNSWFELANLWNYRKQPRRSGWCRRSSADRTWTWGRIRVCHGSYSAWQASFCRFPERIEKHLENQKYWGKKSRRLEI